MSEWTPHPSHEMSEWKNTIVTLIATPRFGSLRRCLKCGYEHAKTVAGQSWDRELEQPCTGDEE